MEREVGEQVSQRVPIQLSTTGDNELSARDRGKQVGNRRATIGDQSTTKGVLPMLSRKRSLTLL